MAVAAAGVLVAHWLAYLVTLPQTHLREATLAATGHGYWVEAVRLVVALAVCGLAALILSHLRGEGLPHERPRLSALVLRLAPIQCLAFLTVETIERIAAHAPLASVLTVRIAVLGLAVQILTACVGAVLLRVLDRAVAGVVAALRRRLPRPRAVHTRRPAPQTVRPRPVLAGASGVRGPPLR